MHLIISIGAIMDISPDKQNIDRVFSNTIYHIDFYQREYKWTEEPVRRLLDDIFYGFEEAYKKKHDLDASLENVTAYYPWYYLNTYVTNVIDGRVYVVDGQQRLTTLTLILVKLRHSAETFNTKLSGWVERKIAGQTGFEQKFWMNHERHIQTLDQLFHDDSDLGSIDVTSGVTALNMLNNYRVISASIQAKLTDQNKLEAFIFYFLNRLVMVNLSVEQTDVPMVFEVINDRGIRLKPYEILKGKLLGQIDKRELDKNDFNGLWERQVQTVGWLFDEEVDTFFRYYLKAKFADTRALGQRFDGDYHREIFKDDLDSKLKLNHNSIGVKKFLTQEFRYYTDLYCKISHYAAERNEEQCWTYFNTLNEMDSQYLLILSSCKIDDPEEEQKIRTVSRQLDRMFVILRLQRAYDSNDFTEAVYEISKAIRNQPAAKIIPAFETVTLSMLKEKRSIEVGEPFQFALFRNTGVSDLSARFTRYFFARIDEFLAKEMRVNARQPIAELVSKTGAKTGFHIEHILSRNNENLKLYDGDEEKFDEDRGRLGGVLLLKGRDNQSSNAEKYSEKLKSYANTLYWNETLREDSYKSKLDLRDLIKRRELPLKPYKNFGPTELEDRQKLLFDISSIIWNREDQSCC
jgi:Protein of unknown function DUF262/Protein of unknown function (DUF1524)